MNNDERPGWVVFDWIIDVLVMAAFLASFVALLVSLVGSFSINNCGEWGR